MKRITFYLLFFFLLTCSSIFAQTDSLRYINGFWLDSQKLSNTAAKEMITENAAALKVFNNGRTMEVISYVIGYPSAFIFGYDLGTRLGGGAGNNTVLLASGIGTAVGLIFGIAAENNYKKSVIIYNSRQKEATSQLSFGITESGGLGFVYRL